MEMKTMRFILWDRENVLGVAISASSNPMTRLDDLDV
jgi:hypothetical protein